MSANILKLIACITMMLDHVGYLMQSYGIGNYDTANLLRLIGRIAFPIFAFLIAEGFKHTRNVVFYTGRLLLAGLISEIPYNLCFHKSLIYKPSLNVLFTLAAALVALIFADMCLKSSKKEVRFLFALPIFAACYFADKFGMDYGYWGIILIFLFYLIDGDSVQKKLLLLPVILLFAARRVIESFIAGSVLSDWNKMQLFALLAFLPLALYNGKVGNAKSKNARKVKQYLFYLFYPVHMLLLYVIFSNIGKMIAFF